MIKENIEKLDYSILTKTEFKDIEDYLYIKDNFSFGDGLILYPPSVKEKVDYINDNFKFKRYRLRYDNISIFFSDDDLKSDNVNTLLNYKITEYIRSENKLFQSVPVNTSIFCSDGTKFNLNNFQLSITYDTMVKNKFYLNDLPTLDDQYIVNYLSESNSLLFNGDRKYLDIREAIIDGYIVLHKEYSMTVNSKTIEMKNILVYNNKPIGTIVNKNELFLNNKNHPAVKINGSDFDISYGITSLEENLESLIYYEDIDALLGSSTFNEYQIGDVIYYKDINKLFLCQYNGLLEIDFQNIFFSYESPEEIKNGMIWFNLSLSTVNLFNGDFWVQLSKVSIKLLDKKISIDKMMGIKDKEYSLEIFGFNKKEEFKTVEMYITKNVITDVEFELAEWFIESVYINGEETYDFHDASWGVHLFNPLSRGDYIQIVISKNKNYDWVIGNVENNDTIVIDHPYEIESIKKLFINGRSYKINNINHNRLKIKDIINDYSEPLILNECDRIYAKVRLTKNLSNVYPSFNVEFKQGMKEVEIPFYSPEHRFDKLMITNNGEPVIVNPQMILQQDRLYAYYDIRYPDKVSFSRYIRKEDNVNIQFVPHRICKFNPESFLTGISSKEDIKNTIIINSFSSFDDESISSSFIFEEIDRINEEVSTEDEILFSQFENNGILEQSCSCGNIGSNENDNEDSDESEEPEVLPELKPKPGNITADEYIPSENQYVSTNISIPNVNFGYDDSNEEIDEMIENITLNSKPDITSKAILEKPTPIQTNKPVLCKPSRTKLNPVVRVYLRDNERYSKYNLKITRDYFKKKDELQNFLVGISEKFANMVENLARMRDALRAIVNYICNILCIAEILKAIIEIFRAIAKAIEAFLNFSWSKLFDKIAEIIKKIGKAIEDFFKKIAKAILKFLNAIAEAVEKFVKAIQNALKKAAQWIEDISKKAKEAFDKAGELMDKIKSFFNMFDITTIGLKIGSFFKKLIQAIMKGIAKIFELICKGIIEFFKLFGKLFDLLSKLKSSISNFTSSFKDMTLSLSIDAIMDFICNKILGSILNLFDTIIDVLDYLQKRFQDFLNKLFADRYKPRGSIVNKMVAAGDFFKDHIDLCDILSQMLNSGDFTLAGFIKRVTNLYAIFKNWKHNRDIMDELIRSGNTDGDAVEGLAGAVTDLENLFVSIDELFGMNKKTIEKLVKKLYKGFIPNFKKTTESVVDVQAMSKQLFDVEKFENFYKKLIIL